MAFVSQSTWISPLHTTNTIQIHLPKTPFYLSINGRPSSLGISSFAMSRPIDESLPPNSADDEGGISDEPKPDRVKLAFEKARKYKKKPLNLLEIQEISEDPVSESAEFVSGNGGLDSGPKGVSEAVDRRMAMEIAGEDNQNQGMVGNGKNEILPGDGDGGTKDIPEAVRIAMEKAKEYQKNKGIMGNVSANVESEVSSEDGESGKVEVPEAVRIAMEKAEEYKKSKGKVGDNVDGEQLPGDVGGGKEEVSEAVRIAMEKAKEYKKNKGTIDDNSGSVENLKMTGSGGSANSLGNDSIERKTGKKEELKISGIDFVGLNFADKKQSRGLPAGLVPVADPYPEGDLPDVEILVGDASKFGKAEPSETETPSEEESEDLYKPKVSTWGMFPRPNNISKTFGGGRTIRPGDTLETPDDKAAKQARTRQLIAAYKKKMGLNMDPKLKAECEKALIDGDSLMDVGRLKEALPYYQKVMDKLAFQTELHGLAAIQWSICQDSLFRPEEARKMYEKLQSHPNAQVSKKARQFMFSFQAMEMMKVTRPTVSRRNTGYQKYFEAFVEDKSNYTSGGTDTEEGALTQAFPYIIFLAFPIFLVLLVASMKGM